MNEANLIRWTIHIGAILYPILAVYMIYLKPETRMEWAVTLKTTAFALVFWRILQLFYYRNRNDFEAYGLLAWGLLLFSFVFTLFAVLTTAFGRRGRRQARLERIAEGTPGIQRMADDAAESAVTTAEMTANVVEAAKLEQEAIAESDPKK